MFDALEGDFDRRWHHCPVGWSAGKDVSVDQIQFSLSHIVTLIW